MSVRDYVQEVRELGLRGTLYRASWELRQRSGWFALRDRWRGVAVPSLGHFDVSKFVGQLPWSTPSDVATTLNLSLTAVERDQLKQRADDAARGRILCFGSWFAEFGNPIDWFLYPATGRKWTADIHCSRALDEISSIGDIKLTWEVARFSHAYAMARAAVCFPDEAARWGESLARQIEQFVAANPVGQGLHWHAGLEVSIRSFSWLFACHVFHALGVWNDEFVRFMAEALLSAAQHVERQFEFAKGSVSNDHLIAEALMLYVCGLLLPGTPRAARWKRDGLEVLVREADRQVYPDGGYFMLSHNYHRDVLQMYLWAIGFHERSDGPAPTVWRRMLDRSVNFLTAQQNPDDGRLPNFGYNDGSQLHELSVCEFADFRPALQAASVVARSERLYPPGAWDEEAAWWSGSVVKALPQQVPSQPSAHFDETGVIVLRSDEPNTFATFRCGSLRDRFGQIDMLHADVWWRGINVLADGGSYLYNGPQEWHRHFVGGASHNTLTVDGQDQMRHWRRFKTLYRTPARVLRFENTAAGMICEGEHTGFQRLRHPCTHRRAILLTKSGLCVVVDHVFGSSPEPRDVRVHWQGGSLPWEFDAAANRLSLQTDVGPYGISIHGTNGEALAVDVVAGQESPPRGWVSRAYAEKTPAPSLVASWTGTLPFTCVTVMNGDPCHVTSTGSAYSVVTTELFVEFTLQDGRLVTVATSPITANSPVDGRADSADWR